MDIDKTKKVISELISEYLFANDCSIVALAAAAGVHRSTISRLLNCRVLADLDTLAALSRVIGVDLAKIYELIEYYPEFSSWGVTRYGYKLAVVGVI